MLMVMVMVFKLEIGQCALVITHLDGILLPLTLMLAFPASKLHPVPYPATCRAYAVAIQRSCNFGTQRNLAILTQKEELQDKSASLDFSLMRFYRENE